MTQCKTEQSRYCWLILAAMTTSLSLVLFDSSVLPVALPTIQTDTQVHPWKVNWLINAYLLTYAALVLAASKLSNRYGNRCGFCFGMTLFALGSLVGGLSTSANSLIFARVVQGFGAAFSAPSSLAIIVDTFPPHKRGQAMGISVSFSSIFYAIGPVIGGVTTEFLSWRMLFWVNIPIAIVGIALALKYVPVSKRCKEPFHLPGFLCLSSGIVCLTVGLMQGRVWGWSSIQVIFLIASSFLFFTLLTVVSRFAKHPFISISLHKNPVYFAGITILFGTQFLMTNAFFWPVYLQKIWGYSPLRAGLCVMISTIPPIFASPLGGFLSDRIGPKVPVLLGILSFVACFSLMIVFAQVQSHFLIVTAMLAFGMGISLVMTPVGTTALSHVPESKRSPAAGFYHTVRFTGGTLGVATLGAIKSNVKLQTFSNSLTLFPSLSETNTPALMYAVARNKPERITDVSLSADLMSKLREIYYAASIYAFELMNIASIFVAMFIFYLAYRSLKPYHKVIPSEIGIVEH